MKFIRNWKTFNKMYEAEIIDSKIIKKHKNMVFEGQAFDDLNKVLQDKKDFLSAYREILLAHKKAIKNKVLDYIVPGTNVTLANQYKENFFKIVTKYNIDTIDKFNNNVANLIKDRIFISLKKDFSAENKVYLDYFTLSKNQPIVKEIPKVTPPVVDNTPLPVTTTTPVTTATPGIVLSPEAKKTLETIKKDYNLPYISTETPKEDKYKSFVLLIQEILKFKGSDIIPDRDFGVKTKDATIKFQTDNKLVGKDGVVGEETWTALLKICGLDIKPKIYNTKIVSGSATTVVPPKGVGSSATTVVPPKGVGSSATTDKGVSSSDTKIVASKLKTGDKYAASSILTEKLDNLDGVQMVVNSPMYKTDSGENFKFYTKDGKLLYYAGRPDGVVPLKIDASGNIAKGSKDVLLYNLDPKPKPPVADLITLADLDLIVDVVVGWMDGDVGIDNLVDINKEMVKLLNSTKNGSKLVVDSTSKTISAYVAFKSRYKTEENGDEFEDDLNLVKGQDWSGNNLKMKDAYNILITNLKLLGSTKKFDGTDVV
jgi:hypothetical protein